MRYNRGDISNRVKPLFSEVLYPVDLQTKKMIKAVPFFQTGISIIALTVSFLIKDIPAKDTYTYINDRIVTHSWHDSFSLILLITAFMIAFTTLICIVIRIIQRKKSDEKTVRHIVILILSFIFCSAVLMTSHVIVDGFWTDDDYSPSYYKFSDNSHTIVIEERSFLLYGGGRIYQINGDHEAILIHEFSTDDGGRNNGNYEINWQDDYAEITYHTFNSNDSLRTDRIVFVNI